MGVKIRVDGIMLLVVLVLVLLAWIWFKRKQIVDAVNPVNPDNVINQAAQNLVGEGRLQSGFDKYFAFWDLINPFNESDHYARQVWGLDGGTPDGIDTSEQGASIAGYTGATYEAWRG
ncbi:hypothetical protein ACJJI5_12385 [Microbulbifer sp. EKSA008]|uniref:hypothetical protein n=1 Tax=Microbulbifer sp. EKSA008 TaxID=3243367 RepID=UPI004042D818